MDIVLPTNNQNKDKQILNAYSTDYFIQKMAGFGWNNETLPNNIAVIILNNDSDIQEFTFFSSDKENVCSLAFHSAEPSLGDQDYLIEYENYIKYKNEDNKALISEQATKFAIDLNGVNYITMTYEQADILIQFILKNRNNDFYIYSTSSSVTAAIADYIINNTLINHTFETNIDIILPNKHVQRLLNRLQMYYDANKNLMLPNTKETYVRDGVTSFINIKGELMYRVRKTDNETEKGKSKRKRRNKDAEQ